MYVCAVYGQDVKTGVLKGDGLASLVPGGGTRGVNCRLSTSCRFENCQNTKSIGKAHFGRLPVGGKLCGWNTRKHTHYGPKRCTISTCVGAEWGGLTRRLCHEKDGGALQGHPHSGAPSSKPTHLLPCCPPASPHPGGGNLSSRREGWLQGTVRPGPAQDLSSFTDLEDPHLGSYSAPWLPETGN